MKTIPGRDTIADARELMRAFKDDRGELLQVNPDLLLVPPGVEEADLRELVKAAKKERQP